MVEAKGGSSPYLVFFFLLPALGLNLVAVVNPLIIEGMIIRAPPPVWTSLDSWFPRSVFGSFSDFPYNVFIPFLLGLYVISFLVGFLVSILLLKPIFGQLLSNREVTFSEGRLALRIGLDFFVVVCFMWFAFNPILAYLTQCPYQLGIIPGSFISLYILTGFITGDGIGKSVFPLRLRWMCRRDKLEFKSFKVVSSSANKGHRESSLIKWVLMSAGRSLRSI